MLITDKTHRQIRLKNIGFNILLFSMVAFLAWLSTRYSFDADWTAAGRNTLSETSVALLNQLDDPVTITSYATEDETLRRSITELLKRYQRHKDDLDFGFINPDQEPEKIRKLGISTNGELVIQYQGRSENVKYVSEQGITNALQRLARSGERWLIFIDGHGERKPLGVANHDLGNWVNQLEAKGFKALTHNLAENPRIPDNTRVLIIAGPQVNLLPGEVSILKQYISSGGNLLWLIDPGNQHGLLPLAESLGISFVPGIIVDPTTQMLGVSDPRFALVSTYPTHPINHNFDTVTLYPQSVGLIITPPVGWLSHNLLTTATRSWSETGEISGSVRFDANKDTAGPFTIGLALTRDTSSTNTDSTEQNTNLSQQPTQQRVVVIGDGDFLSNAYLGNGGNLNMGMNVINWLSHDDTFIEIPPTTSVDQNLELSPLAQGVIGIGFLFVVPLGLAATGFTIWWRRRKQ